MSQPTLYEFHNVPLWAEDKHPVTKSFTAFVMSSYVGRASGSAFFEVDESFGKQKVGYASVFGSPAGQTLEFLIVTDQTQDRADGDDHPVCGMKMASWTRTRSASPSTSCGSTIWTA